MDSIDRILGKLEAHQEMTEIYRNGLDERLDKIETKIDSLQTFKWQVIGACIIFSFIVSIAVEVVRASY